MGEDEDLLPISALQHLAACPRQFALIHLERRWEENTHTALGRALHQASHEGSHENRGSLRILRGVPLYAPLLGLRGVADRVEITNRTRYIPVELKKGSKRHQVWDDVQLCAQALCLEEMTGRFPDEGHLFYFSTRKR